MYRVRCIRCGDHFQQPRSEGKERRVSDCCVLQGCSESGIRVTGLDLSASVSHLSTFRETIVKCAMSPAVMLTLKQHCFLATFHETKWLPTSQGIGRNVLGASGNAAPANFLKLNNEFAPVLGQSESPSKCVLRHGRQSDEAVCSRCCSRGGFHFLDCFGTHRRFQPTLEIISVGWSDQQVKWFETGVTCNPAN